MSRLDDRPADATMNPGDRTPAGTPGTAGDVCPRFSGGAPSMASPVRRAAEAEKSSEA